MYALITCGHELPFCQSGNDSALYIVDKQTHFSLPGQLKINVAIKSWLTRALILQRSLVELRVAAFGLNTERSFMGHTMKDSELPEDEVIAKMNQILGEKIIFEK